MHLDKLRGDLEMLSYIRVWFCHKSGQYVVLLVVNEFKISKLFSWYFTLFFKNSKILQSTSSPNNYVRQKIQITFQFLRCRNWSPQVIILPNNLVFALSTRTFMSLLHSNTKHTEVTPKESWQECSCLHTIPRVSHSFLVRAYLQ